LIEDCLNFFGPYGLRKFLSLISREISGLFTKSLYHNILFLVVGVLFLINYILNIIDVYPQIYLIIILNIIFKLTKKNEQKNEKPKNEK